MKLLLDTHALLWMLADDARLGAAARASVAAPANEAWVSVVSLWEIALKLRLGKLRADFAEIVQALAPARLRLLGIATNHLAQLAQLPMLPDHRDPFDHLLVAQALCDGMTLVSQDRHLARYAVPLLACAG